MNTISKKKKRNNVVIDISICKYFMKIQFSLLKPSSLQFYLTLVIHEQNIHIHTYKIKKNIIFINLLL